MVAIFPPTEKEAAVWLKRGKGVRERPNPQEEDDALAQQRMIQGSFVAMRQQTKEEEDSLKRYEDDDVASHRQRRPVYDSNETSSGDTNPQSDAARAPHTPTALDKLWARAEGFFGGPSSAGTTRAASRTSPRSSPLDKFADFVGDACASTTGPCAPCYFPGNDSVATDEALVSRRHSALDFLGIAPLTSPKEDEEMVEPIRKTEAVRSSKPSPSGVRTFEEIEVTPDHHIQVRMPPTHSKRAAERAAALKKATAPMDLLEVKAQEAAELERSISELTMRSSYGATEHSIQRQIPDNRRMAYYAVGKHHRQSGRGGNRRCYYTGKLILGGAPFYAGTVQQGLRTLVVFCLPSAIGLPDKEGLQKLAMYPNGGRSMGSGAGLRGTIMNVGPAFGNKQHSSNSKNSKNLDVSMTSKGSYNGALQRPPAALRATSKTSQSAGGSVASKSWASKSMMSKLSLDDLSLSIDGDLDPNWGLDRDYLLKVLPEADGSLVKQMLSWYPEQFETLPVQVRDASRWKLYVKFCFFSGLPIAEGELHYKVRDDIAEQVYGEEIALSHEVMVASTGTSAEILALPNRTVMRYLRKHYSQQCGKLEDSVFLRENWERVAPEV